MFHFILPTSLLISILKTEYLTAILHSPESRAWGKDYVLVLYWGVKNESKRHKRCCLSLGCHSELLQTGQHKPHIFISHGSGDPVDSVLAAGEVPADSARAASWFADGHLLVFSSQGREREQREEAGSLVSSYEDANPIGSGPHTHLTLITSLQAPSPNTATGLHNMKFQEDAIQSIVWNEGSGRGVWTGGPKTRGERL